LEVEASPKLFSDSRRLLGANPYFASVGAGLEAVGVAVSQSVLDSWRARIDKARAALDWPDAAIYAKAHAHGATFAFAAPLDRLFAATDVNEWAWLTTAAEAGADRGYARFHAPGFAAVWDEESAVATLRALAASEANPGLRALADAARAHRVELLIDDDDFALGEGEGSRIFPLSPLPDARDIEWASLHDIPVALVTGTNGKTTTVRLLSAMARAHGWRTGHSCTDGLFVNGETIAAGDYSGPAGARAVLRQSTLQAAILETARGGILRRGLAMQRARTAVVTNISADHFGAYGVHDLDDLARVKLTVAHVIDTEGPGSGPGQALLVLNADDPVLCAHAGEIACPIGWFALDDGSARLQSHRANGGATCGVREGRVRLTIAGTAHDLGAITDMPLTVGGVARYNIANLLGASLAAAALGIAPATIAGVLARFGAAHADNPGRLQRWSLGGITVWLDYAHNPNGLRGLLEVARGDDRLGLLLGQAGDRSDDDLRLLAKTAAAFTPARVVLKDIADYLRGRAPGEVAAILRDALVAEGIAPAALAYVDDEERGVRELLTGARPGDILVLPVHGKSARANVVALLDALAATRWRPGQALPGE
jgi:UDP-N-acetylmuramyl tripeptide synthase